MRMSSGVEKLLPFDCLNINEFWAMHLNIHYSKMSLDIQELLLFNCLNFNEKNLT